MSPTPTLGKTLDSDLVELLFQAPSLLLSCLLPHPDDQSSAILLLSAKVPPKSHHRRTCSRGRGDATTPLKAINDGDFVSEDFDDTFEHESLTFGPVCCPFAFPS